MASNSLKLNSTGIWFFPHVGWPRKVNLQQSSQDQRISDSFGVLWRPIDSEMRGFLAGLDPQFERELGREFWR